MRVLSVAPSNSRKMAIFTMDKQTRQILAFHVGDRSEDSAKQLWAKTPVV